MKQKKYKLKKFFVSEIGLQKFVLNSRMWNGSVAFRVRLILCNFFHTFNVFMWKFAGRKCRRPTLFMVFKIIFIFMQSNFYVNLFGFPAFIDLPAEFRCFYGYLVYFFLLISGNYYIFLVHISSIIILLVHISLLSTNIVFGVFSLIRWEQSVINT